MNLHLLRHLAFCQAIIDLRVVVVVEQAPTVVAVIAAEQVIAVVLLVITMLVAIIIVELLYQVVAVEMLPESAAIVSLHLHHQSRTNSLLPVPHSCHMQSKLQLPCA